MEQKWHSGLCPEIWGYGCNCDGVPPPPGPVLYSGGEASRIYQGDVVVRAWFTWPDGVPGEHDTAPMPYEDAIQWLAAAPHTPLWASDGAKLYRVRVERAKILD